MAIKNRTLARLYQERRMPGVIFILELARTRDNADSTTCGLDRIYAERYSSSTTASVYFNSLTVNRKSSPLSAGVNYLEELNLPYDQNTIRIETSNIDFYSKGKGHVRYKLEKNGKNEDWQYGQANQTILFETLPVWFIPAR